MYSPPQISASQCGRAHDIKAVSGSSCHAKPIQSSGASRAYGGIIHSKALGNAPNIGDFDSVDPAPEFVDVDATVNIFPSNTRPITIDVDETAVIAVIIPFEEDLALLLKSVAKYYSSMSGRQFKLYFKT
jgi:hypothetical protein